MGCGTGTAGWAGPGQWRRHQGLVLGERAEADRGAALVQVLRVLDGLRLQFVLVVHELGPVQLGLPGKDPNPVFQVRLIVGGGLAGFHRGPDQLEEPLLVLEVGMLG